MTNPENPSGNPPEERSEEQAAPDTEATTPSPAETTESTTAPDDTPDAQPYEQDTPDTDEHAYDTGGTSASRQMPRIAIIIAGVVVLIAIIGVSVGVIFTRQPFGTPDNSDVIAEVGDLTLTRGDFLRNYTPGQDAQETLDELIEFKLVVQEAREEGLTVDEAEIDEQLEQLRASHQSPEAVEAFLQNLNIGSEEELRDVMGQLQLYQEMITNQIVVEQAHARHILLQASDEAAESGDLHSQPGQEIATKAERRDEADELLSEIEAGADFAELAQEHSDDPGSAQQGGDLGWAPRGVFVPSFDEAIFEMEPGEVRLVESQFGWHIIELLEAPEERPLDNPQFMQSPVVQEQIDATLVPWLEGLRTAAEESNQIEVLVEPTTLVPPEPTRPALPTVQP
ncbi:MAG: peptidylprolyl isomerase [Chloroflexaceae bacterium]